MAEKCPLLLQNLQETCKKLAKNRWITFYNLTDMATLRLYHDTRTSRNDGASPIKLCVSHKGKTMYINLNVSVPAANWDANSSKVIGLANRARINSFITQKRLEAETELLRLTIDGTIKHMDVKQLRDALCGRDSMESKKPDSHGFSIAFREFLDRKSKPRTHDLYARTLHRLYDFCPDLDSLGYEEITKGWLTDFDSFLSGTSPSRNARNIHLRNIRAVFNYAIDEEYTTVYPFRRFKIKQEETRKRFLTVDRLRLLRDYPCDGYLVKYRDIFMLMFYLMGINSVDLAKARKSDVVDGRLEYRRAKTGKLYSIFIEPEAWDIIKRYEGEGEYLLDILDGYANYRDFYAHMNTGLKKIGETVRKGRGGKKTVTSAFPDLSTYWSRHSWATLAYSIGVPKDTISEALGHETGSRITSIYIAFDRKKVDEANRKVLDFLAGDSV